MKPHRIILFLFLFISSLSIAVGQAGKLRSTLTHITGSIPADVGIAVIDLQANDTLSVNGDRHFPMQSVFKFHIALAVLRLVDEGKLSLDQKFHVTKDHFFPTWSVLMRAHPDADIDVTLRELITWSVMNSDNVACDVLFDIIGGPAMVDQFIKTLGVNDIAITANEREMHKEWSVQFDNWTTPNAMAHLLKLFSEGKILKDESNTFLWKLMTDTPNASKRLKGLLPARTVVARKPGTGAPSDEGVLGAVNDVGILVLPNGKKIIEVAFVTNTKESVSAIEQVIAEVSNAVYDHYQE